MRVFIATIVVCLAASVTFGQNQSVNKILRHEELQRRYTLYIPSEYTPESSLPLVVNLHALTRSGDQQIISSGMNEIAEREGFLVAYPDAVNGDWFGPQDNVGFIDALLDQVSSEYSVDASSVYAAGLSQGGMMSYILSVARPNVFAAIASVAGPRPFDFGSDIDTLYPPELAAIPDRPFPLLHMHGTGESFFIPYEGGRSAFRPDYVFPPVEQMVGYYATNNGCDSMSITMLPDVNLADSSTVQLISYTNCNTYTSSSGNSIPAEVLLYRIEGGGHTWPDGGSGPPGEVINHDINASQEIWDFFSRHKLPRLAPGDFDGNSTLDATDVDLLTAAVGGNDLFYDLDGDGQVTDADRRVWVKVLKRTWFGDANLDGVFSSTDLVSVFQIGEFEDAEVGNSTWGDGDWNGDGDFGTGDFVLAFQDGGFEKGPLLASNVPEPTSLAVQLCVLMWIVSCVRRAR